MVWGMRLPVSFGDFFPDGEYHGWNEQLEAYYRSEMSEGDKAALGMKDRLLLSVFANKFTLDMGPVKPQEQPGQFVALKSYSNLGALIKTEDRLIAVDEDLKSIIEGLEPGVHQFWPITITMPKGKVYPKQYYGLRIARFLDSFSPEMSDGGTWRAGGLNKDKFRVNMPKKEHVAGLAMDGAVHSGAQLWREKRLVDPDFFFSDTLHDAIVKAGLHMPTCKRCSQATALVSGFSA